MKKVLLVVLGALVLVGCRKGELQHDTELQQMVSQPGSQEARAWLAAGTHSIGEYTPAISAAHVENLYAKGAIAVTAVNIEKMDGEMAWTDMLVVALPLSGVRRILLLK